MFPKTHLQNILNNWIELWDSNYSTSIVYYSNYGTQLKRLFSSCLFGLFHNSGRWTDECHEDNNDAGFYIYLFIYFNGEQQLALQSAKLAPSLASCGWSMLFVNDAVNGPKVWFTHLFEVDSLFSILGNHCCFNVMTMSDNLLKT